MSTRKAEAKYLKRSVKYLLEKSNIYDMILIYSKLAELPLEHDHLVCFNCPACKGYCEGHFGVSCKEALTNWALDTNNGIQEREKRGT